MIKTRGVYHIGIPVNDVERRSGRGFYFFDPDGNPLQLYAPPRRPSAS